MPTIQTFDPASVAADAAASYFTNHNQAVAQKAAADYQKGRDAKTDANADREFGLQQHSSELADKTFDLNKQNTTSEIGARDEETKIAKAKEERDAALAPIIMQQEQLKAKTAAAGLVTAQDAHKSAQMQLQVDAINVQIARKYGIPKAALALQQGQQDLANSKATQGLIGAQTNQANASAFREMHPVAPRSSKAEQQQDAVSAAIGDLSSQGQAFLDMIGSTNNKPTRLQSLAAVAKSGLSPHDKANLKTVLMSREETFVTPGEQQSETDKADKQRGADAKTEHTEREQQYRDLTVGPLYSALPVADKDLIHSVIVDQGTSIQDAVQHLQDSNMDDGRKQRILRVLSGS